MIDDTVDLFTDGSIRTENGRCDTVRIFKLKLSIDGTCGLANFKSSARYQTVERSAFTPLFVYFPHKALKEMYLVQRKCIFYRSTAVRLPFLSASDSPKDFSKYLMYCSDNAVRGMGER
jgi:hypothetical protein